MKRPFRRNLEVLTVIGLLTLLLMPWTGCAKKQVTRVETDTTIDLSGRWNDSDSRMVSEAMILDCLSNAWLTEHITKAGKRPTVIVGTVRNQSLEHIPSGTFVADLERAMVNSGKVDVVATAAERLDLRAEKDDQWENATDETIKERGREQGADYMLSGTVQSIEDKEKGTKVVFYQVDLTLLDILSNRKAWIGQHKIKKVVSHGSYSP